MRPVAKETNWDQILGDVQNIEKVNEHFTRVLIVAAKKLIYLCTGKKGQLEAKLLN